MTVGPGVEFFIPFHDLGSYNRQCIYFTKYDPPTRCSWRCSEDDFKRAVSLRATILASSNLDERLVLLREYILCNCCISGNARHQRRVLNAGLLMPLARRWQEEITSHRNAQAANVGLGVRVTAGLASDPASFLNETQIIHSAQSGAAPSIVSGIVSSIPEPEVTAVVALSQPRYQTRSKTAADTIAELQAQIEALTATITKLAVSHGPLSEFCPNIDHPLPSDSARWKLLAPLQDRDHETGSVYIFDRRSSPGHIKIGWTAQSVDARLEGWALQCSYAPNLLFKVEDIPHAQRVETLTHYELVKEWRQERMCNGPGCQISHQEWFETDKERAAQIVSDWASFVTKAEPYDCHGLLKGEWQSAIAAMDANGEHVTAARMLEHYQKSVWKDRKPEQESAALHSSLLVPLLALHGLDIPNSIAGHAAAIPTQGSASNQQTLLERKHCAVGVARIAEPPLGSQLSYSHDAISGAHTSLTAALLPGSEQQNAVHSLDVRVAGSMSNSTRVQKFEALPPLSSSSMLLEGSPLLQTLVKTTAPEARSTAVNQLTSDISVNTNATELQSPPINAESGTTIKSSAKPYGYGAKAFGDVAPLFGSVNFLAANAQGVVVNERESAKPKLKGPSETWHNTLTGKGPSFGASPASQPQPGSFRGGTGLSASRAYPFGDGTGMFRSRGDTAASGNSASSFSFGNSPSLFGRGTTPTFGTTGPSFSFGAISSSFDKDKPVASEKTASTFSFGSSPSLFGAGTATLTGNFGFGNTTLHLGTTKGSSDPHLVPANNPAAELEQKSFGKASFSFSGVEASLSAGSTSSPAKTQSVPEASTTSETTLTEETEYRVQASSCEGMLSTRPISSSKTPLVLPNQLRSGQSMFDFMPSTRTISVFNPVSTLQAPFQMKSETQADEPSSEVVSSEQRVTSSSPSQPSANYFSFNIGPLTKLQPLPGAEPVAENLVQAPTACLDSASKHAGGTKSTPPGNVYFKELPPFSTLPTFGKQTTEQHNVDAGSLLSVDFPRKPTSLMNKLENVTRHTKPKARPQPRVASIFDSLPPAPKIKFHFEGGSALNLTNAPDTSQPTVEEPTVSKPDGEQVPSKPAGWTEPKPLLQTSALPTSTLATSVDRDHMHELKPVQDAGVLSGYDKVTLGPDDEVAKVECRELIEEVDPDETIAFNAAGYDWDEGQRRTSLIAPEAKTEKKGVEVVEKELQDESSEEGGWDDQDTLVVAYTPKAVDRVVSELVGGYVHEIHQVATAFAELTTSDVV